MRTAISRNGVPIRLNDERWAHILERHSELAALQDQVVQTILDPDVIYEGASGDLIAQRASDGLYLLVAHKEISLTDGFVITDHLVTRPARKRVLWTRQASTST